MEQNPRPELVRESSLRGPAALLIVCVALFFGAIWSAHRRLTLVQLWRATEVFLRLKTPSQIKIEVIMDDLKRAPTAVNFHRLAGALAESALWRQAARAEQQAIHREPKNPLYWKSLGQDLGKAGMAQPASGALERAQLLDPQDPQVEELLSSMYLRLDRLEDAANAARRSLALNSAQPRVELNLGTAYARAGQTAEAMKIWRHAVAVDPSNAMLHQNLGIGYIELKDWNAVKTEIATLEKIDPARAEWLSGQMQNQKSNSNPHFPDKA